MASNLEQQQQQQQQRQQEEEVEATSSSWANNNNIINNNSLVISRKRNKLELESDEDLLTVPDVETTRQNDNNITEDSTITKSRCSSGSRSSTDNDNTTPTPTQNANSDVIQNQKQRRGRNPVDKEHRRLKRLLRNRVSAQQARERKKVYVNDLELRAKELQDANSKLEDKISTLINENTMLRKVLMNTRPKVDENASMGQQ